MKTLRERKADLLPLAKKIAAFIKREGSGPTVREVADMAGVSSASHGKLLLDDLAECGFIDKIQKKARAIKMKDNFLKV